MDVEVWVSIVFFELFQEGMFVYPNEYGMSKEEFIEENFMGLFVVRESIKYKYGTVFTSQYKHIFDKAINAYFRALKIPKPDTPNFHHAVRERNDKLQYYLACLGPYWKNKRRENREFRERYLEAHKLKKQ